ncbi:MAG: hypothetical protein R3224_02230, partial [Balneolaceae bacterium]|nr:hypothetical protein [Balneolaceae bacterium]
MKENPTDYLQPTTGRHGLAFILAGAVLLSFSPVFVETANVAPTLSAFYRMLFGGLILMAIVAGSKERLWPGINRLGWPLICA